MKELLLLIVILLIYISIQLSIVGRERKTEKIEKVIESDSSNNKLGKVVDVEISNMNGMNNSLVSNCNRNVGNCLMPINVPTRGECEDYKQIGVITSEDNTNILPLFGRRLWNGAYKWLYYTQTDRFVSVRLPVYNKGRNCSGEYGCDELSDNDEVTVPQLNSSFKVTLYHLDTPRYIPYVC